MKAEIKAIFLNQMTWLVLLILLVFNLTAVISLETFNSRNQTQKAQQAQYSLLLLENTYASEKSTIEMAFSSKADLLLWNEYFKYKEWLIDEQEKAVQRLLNSPGSVDQAYEQRIGLITMLLELNNSANPDIGDTTFQIRYAEELKLHENDLMLNDLDFDYTIFPQLLSSLPSEVGDSDEENHLMYQSYVKAIDRAFYMLDAGETDASASPWLFLANQLSYQTYLPLLIGVLALLFSAATVSTARRNRSLQLQYLRHPSKNTVLAHYALAVWVSFMLILLVTFLLPLLLEGLLHGFGGLRQAIYVDL
ncbi:MAG: ABC transporter permease subunit [Oscillospiraceae bacterium]|nr:ABC transporter permease subunit [Oscillospiraceae bacterium]MDD4368893.1 ABC transporter permease subunit [Oscillospiraceae bacterium]